MCNNCGYSDNVQEKQSVKTIVSKNGMDLKSFLKTIKDKIQSIDMNKDVIDDCWKEVFETLEQIIENDGKAIVVDCVTIRIPKCFVPNDGVYPLCKGKENSKCELCCLYENMNDSPEC